MESLCPFSCLCPLFVGFGGQKNQSLSLAWEVPFVLSAALWPLGPLLSVLPALAAPFVAVVPVGVVEPVPAVPVPVPSLSPCLCCELDLQFGLRPDVLWRRRQLLLFGALVERIPVQEVPSQPFSEDFFLLSH